jgi:beta-lactamase class D
LAAIVVAALAASGCAPPPRDRLDQERLNADIDRTIGGLGTCVIVLDTQSGRKLYQYGQFDICHQPLPPCETFEVPAALIGLDAGLIAPRTVVKWDGTPQPTRALQVDANMQKAFADAIGWWFARLSRQIGQARYAARLGDFDYGSKAPTGPVDSFWQGPARGGGLTISTVGQARFLQRLFAGALPVRPGSAAAVEAALQTESHGGGAISGLAGSCSDQADRGRGVGWWVGRLKSAQRDLTFAAVVESAEPPPGSEVETNLKDAFADAGLWPAAAG